MTGKSLIHYARLACRYPRIASGTLIHRVRVRAIRTLGRRPVILFERHAGIGDLICTFPAVLALRNRYPDGIIVYSVWKSFKAIVEMSRVADYVVEMDWSKEMPKVEYRDYDFRYQPWLEGEQLRGREHLHLVDDFAQTLDVTLISRQPRLYVPPNASALMRKWLAPLRKRTKYIIGIHVGPSWPVREWTIEGWTKLVALMCENLDCTVIQLGSDVHTAKGNVKIARIFGAEDWIGKLNLEESVATLKQLNLFIGIDSGLLHAAGAVGTRTVGLFGPINPKLRLPPETPSVAVTADVPCLGCHHRLPCLHWQENCPNEIQCMNSIKAADVFKAVLEFVKQS